jgi:eukaryotic-like serine/threonine-protein kinase
MMRDAGPEEHRGIAGTMLYMSPEQLRREPIDGRSDLFSLGVVLYQLATGICPFERSEALLSRQAVLHDSLAPRSSLNPALPAELDRVIGRMLEKDRERRYRSAVDVSRDLPVLGESLTRPGRKWKLASIGTGVLLVSSVGAIFFERHRAPVVTDKDTMVLAEFENKTGDPIFSETLRQGLSVQLQQSPFLSLVSEERIQHVLRLMTKPPDTPLTGDTAREVCERTASAAVLDGSIASLGKEYVLLLRAKNCRRGELLYTEQAEATRKEDVLRALSQMAHRFREKAGESRTTIAQHSTPLSEATTPSLDAWKSFSEGMKVGIAPGACGSHPLHHTRERDRPAFRDRSSDAWERLQRSRRNGTGARVYATSIPG